MKYAVLAGTILLIIIIMVVLVVMGNNKAAKAEAGYASANAEQSKLADWWDKNNPFANGTGLPVPKGPTQAECDAVKEAGGVCITGNDVFNWIFGG